MRRVVLLTLALAFVSTTVVSIASRASTAPTFVFTAAGDYAADNHADAVLTAMNPASSNADFALALGDLSYNDLAPESAWCDFVKARVGESYPFMLVSGNHEDDDPAGNNIDNFAACLPDRLGVTGRYSREYYFDYPSTAPIARFIMISPDLTFLDEGAYSYAAGTSHYNWLASTIDGARTIGLSWVIVGMHKNCITMGIKSCEIGTDLLNLMIDKKVDLILEGHDHTYQRSKQLALSSSCTAVPSGSYNSSCVVGDGSDGQYVKGLGSVLAIVGSGGNGLYNVDPADSEAGYFAAFMGANNNPSWGFFKTTISDTSLSASFVPVIGTFSDSFTILASGAPTSTPTPTPSPTPPTVSARVNSSSDDAEENVSRGSVSLTSSDLEFVADGTTVQTVGIRFNNLAIPQGATITNAYIEFTVDEVQSETTSLTFFGQAINNAPTFTSATRDVSSRTKTTSQVIWNAIPAWDVVGAKKQTPNLSSIVQEIVNRAGWASGNSIAFVVTGNGHRTAEAYDKLTPGAAKLVVSYITVPTPTFTPTPTLDPNASPTPTNTATATPTPSPTPTMTPTPTSAPNVVNLNPIADTYVSSKSPNSNYGTKTTLGVDGSPIYISYLKFDESSLAGLNITSAKLRIKIGTDKSTALQNIRSVADTSWGETTLNYNTRPSLGATINTFTSPLANTWVEIDVTNKVQAMRGGLMSLGIDETSSDGLTIYSRETVDKPVLVVSYN
jgi:calcineurin-like phosphoesterase family protein